jgi:mRNA interferase MazF
VIVERGAVVVVPFPFADRPVSKRRPAVVMSGRSFNESQAVTTLAMITTGKRMQWPGDVPIGDLSSAGLREPCVVRPRLGTIDNRFIDEVIGELSERDRQALRRSIERLFGWSR